MVQIIFFDFALDVDHRFLHDLNFYLRLFYFLFFFPLRFIPFNKWKILESSRGKKLELLLQRIKTQVQWNSNNESLYLLNLGVLSLFIYAIPFSNIEGMLVRIEERY